MLTPEFLQQRFFAGLERRVVELHALLDRPSLDEMDLETISRAFHSLAGIGGTYGFPLVTAVARDAEHFCDSLCQPVRDTDLQILRRAVADLEQFRLAAAA